MRAAGGAPAVGRVPRRYPAFSAPIPAERGTRDRRPRLSLPRTVASVLYRTMAGKMAARTADSRSGRQEPKSVAVHRLCRRNGHATHRGARWPGTTGDSIHLRAVASPWTGRHVDG